MLQSFRSHLLLSLLVYIAADLSGKLHIFIWHKYGTAVPSCSSILIWCRKKKHQVISSNSQGRQTYRKKLLQEKYNSFLQYWQSLGQIIIILQVTRVKISCGIFRGDPREYIKSRMNFLLKSASKQRFDMSSCPPLPLTEHPGASRFCFLAKPRRIKYFSLFQPVS